MNCDAFPRPARPQLIAGLVVMTALALAACLAGPAVADEDSIAKGQALWR
jgi:hypothetical protein